MININKDFSVADPLVTRIVEDKVEKNLIDYLNKTSDEYDSLIPMLTHISTASKRIKDETMSELFYALKVKEDYLLTSDELECAIDKCKGNLIMLDKIKEIDNIIGFIKSYEVIPLQEESNERKNSL